LCVDVPSPEARALVLDNESHRSNESESARAAVVYARERQQARQGVANARLDAQSLARYCAMSERAQALLSQALSRLALSARAYHRIAKVARTIADLADSPTVEAPHVAEAIGYRRFDLTQPLRTPPVFSRPVI
jgi:magnesium chelatase family protein